MLQIDIFDTWLKSIQSIYRLQIIVVAKKYIYVSQLFISRMPKMRAIPQLVSAPLNPIPIAGATHRVSTVADNTCKWGK